MKPENIFVAAGQIEIKLPASLYDSSAYYILCLSVLAGTGAVARAPSIKR